MFCGLELCLDGFLVKLNMLVRSLPNCLALERLLEATFTPSLLLTPGMHEEPFVESTCMF